MIHRMPRLMLAAIAVICAVCIVLTVTGLTGMFLDASAEASRAKHALAERPRNPDGPGPDRGTAGRVRILDPGPAGANDDGTVDASTTVTVRTTRGRDTPTSPKTSATPTPRPTSTTPAPDDPAPLDPDQVAELVQDTADKTAEMAKDTAERLTDVTASTAAGAQAN